MIKYYIKIAIRSLIKNKTYSGINILGLSISLAVFILMFLWVKDEFYKDKFHANSERLFRVKRTIPLEKNVYNVYRSITYPLLKAAEEQLPEVEKYIPIGHTFEDNIKVGEKDFRAEGTYTNAAFFESFSYSVTMGDISQLDKKLESVVISERLAERIFGKDWRVEALGSTIEIMDNGRFVIDAVYANFPSSSSIQNDFYYSAEKHLKDNQWLLEWGNSNMQGVLLLAENVDQNLVSDKLEKILQSNIPGENKGGCFLQIYADDYLYGQFNDQAQVSGGKIEYVKTFGIAALLLLIISCINFVNLATVLASKRAKEVGVRKTFGAQKKVLINQFMVEAASLTFISILLALGIARLLIPHVNLLTNKILNISLAEPFFLISLFVIFLLTTLLTGAYPAFILSSFKPINVFRSNNNKGSMGMSFRKGLVVMQFCLSLMLILGAVVVQQQIHFIKNKNLGINKDNLIAIHQDDKLTENFELLSNELKGSEGIQALTLVGPSPLNVQTSTSGGGITWPGKRKDQENIEFSMLWTAQNFPEVFDIPLVDGTYYKPGQLKDDNYIVLNEKGVKTMGIKDPIGKTIQWRNKSRQIIGVIKDFHNQSLHNKIEPAVFLLDANNAGWMFVKAQEGRIPEAITSLETAFKKILPNVPLHYEFLDEQYQKMYASENLTGTLANYFAIISMIISCLGLFGLVTIIGQERTKEISIRKVLGANIATIMALLSKEFIQLIVIAFLIAFPIGWYFMDIWLGNFEYKVDIPWYVFTTVGLMAIGIAILTISIQTIKAARGNPIESLRAK